jgi:exopolysaccharide biosynthesis polyprenyl glycosylphosphotransferase
MKILGKREPAALLIGDLFIFTISLWFALYLRAGVRPTGAVFLEHMVPFSMLFVVWVVVFFIAGLYGKHTLILKTKLPSILLNALLINSVIATTFFYFVPLFGIAPKTILFIYLALAFAGSLAWRFYGYALLGTRNTVNAILIGSGPEADELYHEVNRNNIYSIRFTSRADARTAGVTGFAEEMEREIVAHDVSVMVIDLGDEMIEPIMPHLYDLIFSKVTFIDMHKVYEDVFDRVPLSLLRYDWFLENISTRPKAGYDTLKRLMDIFISGVLLLIAAPFFPLIALAIKLDSRGPAFITQERFGQNNKIVKLYKFRSMERSDAGAWPGESENQITRVGKFLRKSRIDELPQLWNVLKGDLSLIGPRPDIHGLGVKLQSEIPYYNIRNIVRPGLSGWAQISQDIVPHSVEETKARLSYDLYYIKNRSFVLDIQIALKTLKTLASRVGR